MAIARFRVQGRLDSAGRLQEGTVTIDRAAELFSVRPLRRRKVYTLPLSTVADMVCQRIILGEASEKRRLKREKQKMKRAL
jgi:hypothetical protein